MSYLLDTNVLSELARRKPHEKVADWFSRIPRNLLYISVLTIGEIRKGIEDVKDAERKERLFLWLEIDVREWFGKRILETTLEVADRWGRLQSEMKRPIPAIDSLIAATALHHDLTLVTRNTRDFTYPSLQLINPWE